MGAISDDVHGTSSIKTDESPIKKFSTMLKLLVLIRLCRCGVVGGTASENSSPADDSKSTHVDAFVGFCGRTSI
eukprot:7005213-Ditylum_brightwellii.AAC.1